MVDVVIPLYRPDAGTGILLRRLLKQDYEINRIILINTEKEYFNEELLFDPVIEVHHITKPEFDHGATRHMGMELSDADYVLFLTMDAIPADTHLISSLVKCFEHRGSKGEPVVVAYGRQLASKKASFEEKYTRNYNYPPQGRIKTIDDIKELGIKTYFCSDVCAMYDRAAYFSNGGFPEKIIFNEDMVYASKAMKNGYAVEYCAKARVYHSHNYSFREQFRRNFDMGVSQKDYEEVFSGIKSENEGIKMVVSAAEYMMDNGHWYDIPHLFINSAAKYTGYRLGKIYKHLGKKIILKLTSNKEYWESLEE